MPTVFPAHMYVLAPDHLWYLSLRPKSLGEVHVRFGASLAPEVMNSLNDPQSFVGELVDFFDRVNEEDHIVVERLYQGTVLPWRARAGCPGWSGKFTISSAISIATSHASRPPPMDSLPVRAKAG